MPKIIRTALEPFTTLSLRDVNPDGLVAIGAAIRGRVSSIRMLLISLE